MENKALFLDYDGVLFDTLKEVYVVNRYINIGNDFEDKIDEKNYKLYSKYKFLVYNIWMFYYYNPLIFGNIQEEKIIPSFNEALMKRNLEEEKKYCSNFLNIRSDLIKNNYNFWKNLETPFQFFNDIKKLYEEKNINLIIASKKNKSSIIERLKANNFNLDEKFIFAREVLDKYSSKGEFINEYMKQNNYSEAIFVDDNPNNIITCDNYKNIKTILASWGNGGVDSKGLSQEEAIFEIESFFSK